MSDLHDQFAGIVDASLADLHQQMTAPITHYAVRCGVCGLLPATTIVYYDEPVPLSVAEETERWSVLRCDRICCRDDVPGETVDTEPLTSGSLLAAGAILGVVLDLPPQFGPVTS